MERAFVVLVSTLAALALANYLAFTYAATPGQLEGVSTPGPGGIEGACFGLLPPHEIPGLLSVRPGRVVCWGGAPVYESLYVSLRLTPGSWTLKLGSFYSRTPRPLVVMILVEVPLEGVDAELIVVGEGWTTEIPMTGARSRRTLVLEGESRFELLLRAKTRGPTSEHFRVGFHVSAAS